MSAYALLGLGGGALAIAFTGSAITREPWLPVGRLEGAAASLVLGATGAALALIVTRVLFRRARWARALHDSLRPLVVGRDDLWLMAFASGVSEELFFRGFLSATMGVWLSSLAFGALHRLRGRAGHDAQLATLRSASASSGASPPNPHDAQLATLRSASFGWMGTAFAMGLFLSVLYALTGNLLGCVVAHVAVNAVNLQYLRDHDPNPPKPRKLGGLLATKS